MPEATRKWGTRKVSKSSEISEAMRRKEGSIKSAVERKEVGISVNAAVSHASFLLTTLVGRGELLGEKLFSLEWYFKELGLLAKLFRDFSGDMLQTAIKEYTEHATIEVQRVNDYGKEAKEYAMVDEAISAQEELI